jgi:hypothetical protein
LLPPMQAFDLRKNHFQNSLSVNAPTDAQDGSCGGQNVIDHGKIRSGFSGSRPGRFAETAFVEIYNGPLNGSAGVRDLATDSLTVSQPLAPFWLRGEKEPASGPS